MSKKCFLVENITYKTFSTKCIRYYHPNAPSLIPQMNSVKHIKGINYEKAFVTYQK